MAKLITVSIEETAAEDLAQLVKRIQWDHVRACAAGDEEAYRMRTAIEQLQSALAGKGFSPR